MQNLKQRGEGGGILEVALEEKERRTRDVSTLFLCNPIKLQECRYRLQLEAKAIKTYLGCHGEFFGH